MSFPLMPVPVIVGGGGVLGIASHSIVYDNPPTVSIRSLTVPIPTGTTDGDSLILIQLTYGTATSPIAFLPSGWTSLGNTTTAGNTTRWSRRTYATSDGPSYVVQYQGAGSLGMCAILLRIPKATFGAVASPFDGGNIPTINVATVPALYVALLSASEAGKTWTAPPDFAEYLNIANIPEIGRTISIQTRIITVAGATGVTSFAPVDGINSGKWASGSAFLQI